MPYEDLNLTQAGGVYTLSDPTSDPMVKVLNRVTVMLLSCPTEGRGSYFIQELNAGRLKTQADVISAFNLSVAQLLGELREISYELTPVDILLSRVDQLSVFKIKLWGVIIASDETIPFALEATT